MAVKPLHPGIFCTSACSVASRRLVGFTLIKEQILSVTGAFSKQFLLSSYHFASTSLM